MNTKHKKINGFTLTTLVVTTAIGSGIFALSSDLAKAAAPGPALLAWLVISCGILPLAATFNNLLRRHPELEGIYAYGQQGFGDFVGFISGWGYWMSGWLGNVAFSTVFISTLGYFFPIFQQANGWPAILAASVCSWFLTWLVNQGLENAAIINSVITLCKLIPIITFIICSLFAFRLSVFTHNFWGNFQNNFTWSSVLLQIKSCFMVMMWLFVGIEGATVLSSRAKSQRTAGRATIIGVICLLLIDTLASILPYGYFTRAQLIHAPQPAMAYLLAKLVGPWGGRFISIGLLISIFGAWISWTMLPAETLSSMATQKLLPARLGKTNHHQAPTLALVITGVVVQIFLITLLFTKQAYELAYSLSTAAVIVSYIIVAAYQIKDAHKNHLTGALLLGIGTLIFELGGMLCAGIKYLFLCTIIYLPGIYLYYRVQHHELQQDLTKHERYSSTGIILLGTLALVLVCSGQLNF
ncbi:basic amino acid/polyamine antiporter [Bombilactobacillus folatiphilus]|uniref:Basic amino acid/polyamine antiporter n=1 Tax=Bombilactobacillus folatiphilus TaxID=2923362 RepID=A0ABY4P892_9LACO|nr:basic amino acid/polyamine antiporter [Bombilactobacillus folatiphilus]UQS81882.1 basic amino acid/polyamine antiporter [Bombilactobacillus folatiphilus]